MTTTTIAPAFTGTYQADPIHSSFDFAVSYMGVTTFRGSLGDVRATLRGDADGAVLEGAATVESISISDPPEFRAHVLGPEFFDAENHPEVTFRSSRLDLGADGSARLEGELTIKGISQPVSATGTWIPPRETPSGRRASLEVETTIDRREFGLDWQMELPDGGNALAYDVTLTVRLALVSAEA